MGLVAFCVFVLFLTLFNTFWCWGQIFREKQNICREAWRPSLNSELGSSRLFSQNNPQAYWIHEVKDTSCIHRVGHVGSIPPPAMWDVGACHTTLWCLSLPAAWAAVLGRWGRNTSATEDSRWPYPTFSPRTSAAPPAKIWSWVQKKIIYVYKLFMYIYTNTSIYS